MKDLYFLTTTFVLGTVAILFSAVSQNHFLLALTLLFFSILNLFQMNRFVRFFTRLSRFLPGSSGSLDRLISDLAFQKGSLKWENDYLQSQLSKQVLHRSEQHLDPQTDNEDPLTLREAVSDIAGMFRASCTAILIERENQIAVYRRGVGGVRLEKQLCEAYKPYLNEGSRQPFRTADNTAQKLPLLQDFSIFGVRYTVAAPFTWQEGEKTVAGVLWLGYRDSAAPYDSEISQVRVVTQELSAILSEQHKIQELSSRAIAAEQTITKKDDYIAHLSHDVRTPLNNVSSILYLLRVKADESEQIELIETALSNCTALKDMVDGVLEYSKHRAGELAPRTEKFTLRTLLEKVIDDFRITAKLKGLLLEFSCCEKVFLNADRRQVRRIVTNLVSNALKYTEQGKVCIHVCPKETKTVEISVQDSGIGISLEQQEKLFTPFSRFQNGQNTEGAGLGLTLTKILTELNSGTVMCKSAPGKGSVFTVILPGEISEQEGKAETIPLTTLTSDLSILVVDDDYDCASSLAQTLKINGYRTSIATNEGDAISICNFLRPDVVIADRHMPGGGAQKIISDLKKRAISPVFFTVSGSEDTDSQGQPMFQKPIDIQELVAALSTLQEESSKYRSINTSISPSRTASTFEVS